MLRSIANQVEISKSLEFAANWLFFTLAKAGNASRFGVLRNKAKQVEISKFQECLKISNVKPFPKHYMPADLTRLLFVMNDVCEDQGNQSC